jgi:hypothetical protein
VREIAGGAHLCAHLAIPSFLGLDHHLALATEERKRVGFSDLPTDNLSAWETPSVVLRSLTVWRPAPPAWPVLCSIDDERIRQGLPASVVIGGEPEAPKEPQGDSVLAINALIALRTPRPLLQEQGLSLIDLAGSLEPPHIDEVLSSARHDHTLGRQTPVSPTSSSGEERPSPPRREREMHERIYEAM